MEGKTTVEVAPQAPKAPQSESPVGAPAIRNAQSQLQSAIGNRPSTNYQELARTFIHTEPEQVAKDPLRAAFFIWGAYALETLLTHHAPKDEEYRALAAISASYAAAQWLKKHPDSYTAQEVARMGINAEPATQVKLVFEMKDEVLESKPQEEVSGEVIQKIA